MPDDTIGHTRLLQQNRHFSDVPRTARAEFAFGIKLDFEPAKGSFWRAKRLFLGISAYGGKAKLPITSALTSEFEPKRTSCTGLRMHHQEAGLQRPVCHHELPQQGALRQS